MLGTNDHKINANPLRQAYNTGGYCIYKYNVAATNCMKSSNWKKELDFTTIFNSVHKNMNTTNKVANILKKSIFCKF